MSEKRGWHVTKSPPLNPPLNLYANFVIDSFEINESFKISKGQQKFDLVIYQADY